MANNLIAQMLMQSAKKVEGSNLSQDVVDVNKETKPKDNKDRMTKAKKQSKSEKKDPKPKEKKKKENKKAKKESNAQTQTNVKNKEKEHAEPKKTWNLDRWKLVQVKEFNGNTIIDIREYYVDKLSNDFKPGSSVHCSTKKYPSHSDCIDRSERCLPEYRAVPSSEVCAGRGGRSHPELQ